MKCYLCANQFDPRLSPVSIVGGKWLCCDDRYTPEELAEELDLPVSQVYSDLGLEQPTEIKE